MIAIDSKDQRLEPIIPLYPDNHDDELYANIDFSKKFNRLTINGFLLAYSMKCMYF